MSRKARRNSAPALNMMGVCLLFTPRAAQALPDPPLPATRDQTRRLHLAQQTVSLSTAFLEAQRAGNKPADGDTLCPQVWSWKKPAFANPCKAYRRSIATSVGPNAQFSGFFEAGSAHFHFRPWMLIFRLQHVPHAVKCDNLFSLQLVFAHTLSFAHCSSGLPNHSN
jgi:hypothetical protein